MTEVIGGYDNNVTTSMDSISNVTVTKIGTKTNLDVKATTDANNYAMKITESGSYTYIAKAAVGSAQSSAVWQVFRLDETSGLVITWADGDNNFDNVATDLTALTYS